MKSIRVLLTDNCNKNCSNCINSKFRTGTAYMDTERFIRIAEYFHNNQVKRIRIMGGEPTLHPDFALIVKESQLRFDGVTVFTNGTIEKLKDFAPRDIDGINYNGKFISRLSSDMILINEKGSRVISIVIDDGIITSEVNQQLDRIHAIWPELKVSLTFDCTANIFKKRSFFLKKFNELYNHCQETCIEVIIDHATPLCFIYGSSVPIQSKSSLLCNTNCSGLIDARFNVRFCNQIFDDVLPLFRNDQIVPFRIVENFLLMAHFRKQLTVLDKICKNCSLYGQYCNGGCYVQNPHISANDILTNTQLPTMPKHIQL